jgi:hypothetical protein
LHRQASLDLRLRDPAGEMEREGEPRIGPLVGSGRGGGRAADLRAYASMSPRAPDRGRPAG